MKAKKAVEAEAESTLPSLVVSETVRLKLTASRNSSTMYGFSYNQNALVADLESFLEEVDRKFGDDSVRIEFSDSGVTASRTQVRY